MYIQKDLYIADAVSVAYRPFICFSRLADYLYIEFGGRRNYILLRK